MSISSSGFDKSNSEDHVINPSDVESGTGGPVLESWTKDRQTLLRDLLSAGNSENRSSFSIPAGIVSNGWDIAFEDGELNHGSSVSGVVLNPDGNTLSGVLTVFNGDSAVAQSRVNGRINVNGPPPGTILSGESVGTTGTEAVFEPDVSAVPLVTDEFTLRSELGTIQYGELTGRIVTYDGDPVPNDPVKGIGDFGDVTDSNGKFNVIAPGDTEIQLSVFNGKKTISRFIDSGSSSSIEITYPKLTIEVLDSDYRPIENAPVDINGSRKYTDERGIVEMPKTPVGLYNITVMSDFSIENFEVSKEGQLYELMVSPGETFGSSGTLDVGSLEIDIVDQENGEPISDVEAILIGEGRVSLTNNEGTVRLLSDNVGSSAIVAVAPNDSRYEQEIVEVEVPQDTSGYDQVSLSRGSDSPTY